MDDFKYLNEEELYDEGYAKPAKVYVKGQTCNFYEGSPNEHKDWSEYLEDNKSEES